MPTVPQTYGVPQQIEQGNYYNFIERLECFPSNQWTGTLFISQGTLTPVSVAASIINTDEYLFTLNNAFTLPLAIGNWDWAIYVTAGGEQQTAKGGSTQIIQTLQTAQVLTSAQQMVATLNATLQAVAAKTTKSWNFNSQQAQNAEIADLQKQIVYWESRVLREKEQLDEQRGVRKNNAINTRFAPQQSFPGAFFGPGPWI